MKIVQRLVRWNLAIVATSVYVAVIAARASGREALLRSIGIPALRYSFGDLRVITAGWQCAQRAIDPLRSNPCDPEHRPMNYPRIWLLPGKIGLDDRPTVAIGVLLGGLFLVSVLVVFGRTSPRGSPIALLAICSPPCLLILERANNDIVVFALVVLAIVLSERTLSVHWALAPLAMASLLKLYPAVCLVGLLWRRPSRAMVIGSAVTLGSFVVYLLLSWEDLRLVSRGTPRPTTTAYGSSVLPDILGSGGRAADRFGLALLVLVFVGGCALGRKLRGKLASVGAGVPDQQTSPTPPSGPNQAFVLGTALYVGTYALGNNFDYRLVMLLLVIPQLLLWAREPTLAPFAWGALFAVIGSLWLGRIMLAVSPSVPPLDEVTNWMLVAALPALAIGTSSPMRLRSPRPARL